MQKVYDIFVRSLPQYNIEVVAVNDGSKDNTLNAFMGLKRDYSYLKIIDLSRNFGKEAALSAGLKFASGDAVIPIDIDLQQPLESALEMIPLWELGYEVVIAKRTDRKSDGTLQKIMARMFYKVHNAISDIEIPTDVGDFRLMDRKVVDALNKMPENRRFMKGLFAWVGFKTTSINYIHGNRDTGKSKFNSWKLWNLALEGITGFSTVPLKISTYIGIFIASSALFYAIFLIIKTIFFGSSLAGYPSIMVSILFLGGVQLIGIGILGEYVGRIYMESKHRPPFIAREVY